MSAAQLLHDLKQMGVHLEVAGERLRYSPKAALTPEVLERLRRYKFELLAILREQTERPTVNLDDPNAVWQAALNELEGDKLFPAELLQALRSARVAWNQNSGPGHLPAA
jgi:hypothetical protein